ncbi:MAG: DUF748 domain-containing protein [Burkholderiaceae bacterium]
MAVIRTHRRWLWLVGIVIGLALTALLCAYLAASKIRGIAQDWLGEQGRASHISVSWNRVLMTDVVIDTPKGWPGEQALKAARVVIEPRWAALISNEIEISSLTVSDYRLTVYRKRAGGVDVLPSLREQARERSQKQDGRKRETRIDALVFDNGTIDFYDGQVSRPAHHIPITNAQARIGPLHFPAGDQRTEVSINGDFPGKPAGKMTNKGWIVVGSRDADIETSLSNISVKHVAPYFQRGSDLAFNDGRVALALHTRVNNKQINALGKLTLSDLELADGGLLALPKRAAIAALEDSQGRAQFDFTLSGPLSKPVFKMEDNLSMRVAGGLAGVLGISIEGLASGIGHTVEGIGSALGNLTGSATR